MDPLQGNEAIQQFIKLLEENGRQGQAADLSALMWYMDGMSRQYDAVLQELQSVCQQLAQVQEPSVKYVMQGAAAKLESKAHQIKDTLDSLWEKIARCAAAAVENFKEAGVSALDKAVSAIGVKNVLESLQEKISGMIVDTKQNIEKVERRLQFEAPPPTAVSAPTPSPGKDAPPKIENTAGPTSRKEDTPPPCRKFDKAVRRAERAEQKVERARADLPTKRRLSFQPEPDSETGKPRRRLHFEQEVLPEYRPPSLPARAGGMAKTAAVMKLHSKIHESERQNVAVEATHKGELFAEQGVGRALRWQRNRRRSKPYRALRQAEQRAAKEKLNLAWQTALRDNPELQRKNAFAKWLQKQKIKQKYAQAAHEAKQTAQFTQNVVHATGQIIRAIQQYAAAHKSLLAVVALLASPVI